MGNGMKVIGGRLSAFKRKYYLNLFIKGSLLTLSLILVYYLIASLIEYNLWLSGWARFLLFLSFIAYFPCSDSFESPSGGGSTERG
jgi:hypothetical protein